MLNYANQLRLRDGISRSDSRGFITMLTGSAMELRRQSVATPSVTMSAPSLDTSDEMPPPARRRRCHSPQNSRMYVTITSASTSLTHNSNSSTDNTLTTRVTDGDVRIETMLRDSTLGIFNHVETSSIPGVTYRYSPFMQLHIVVLYGPVDMCMMLI